MLIFMAFVACFSLTIHKERERERERETLLCKNAFIAKLLTHFWYSYLELICYELMHSSEQMNGKSILKQIYLKKQNKLL